MLYSYLTPKAIVRDSDVDGKGSIAIEHISKGEVVFIKSGYILTRDTMLVEKVGDNYWPLSDELFLAPKKNSSREEIIKIKLFINHSCNPNCGIRGEVTGVAIRDIKVGEELTFDYAMIDDETDERYTMQCTCGEADCRGIITGKDWEQKELQKKYKGYFARYLQEKIDKLDN